jgi:hypothetical protein
LAISERWGYWGQREKRLGQDYLTSEVRHMSADPFIREMITVQARPLTKQIILI